MLGQTEVRRVVLHGRRCTLVPTVKKSAGEGPLLLESGGWSQEKNSFSESLWARSARSIELALKDVCQVGPGQTIVVHREEAMTTGSLQCGPSQRGGGAHLQVQDMGTRQHARVRASGVGTTGDMDLDTLQSCLPACQTGRKFMNPEEETIPHWSCRTTLLRHTRNNLRGHVECPDLQP